MTQYSRLLLALTTALLLLRTVTAMAQEASVDDTAPPEPVDHFAVDTSPTVNRAVTLELRPEATVYGDEIHLRQICRWSDTDAPVFTPIADLTLARFGRARASHEMTLDELRDLLQGASVNIATIRFCGAVRCSVTRSDAATAVDDDARAALEKWAAQATPTSASAAMPAAARLASEQLPLPTSGETTPSALRQKLLEDLSQRLNLPAADLDVSFDPRDGGLLNMSEPNFSFDIRARHVHDLGDVRWDVTLMAGSTDPSASSAAGSAQSAQHVAVNATARAWQQQLVLTRPVSYKQVFQDEDVEAHRVLIDSLPDAPVLPKSQVVGQEAARDLQTGTVMTARLVEPVPLAKSGQFVTVTLNTGSIQIRTVAKALESGSFGQAIKLRNEDTNDVFEATLIGPQQATIGSPAADAGPAAVAAAN